MACDEEEMDGEDEVVLNEEHLRMWERERQQEIQDLQLVIDDCSRNKIDDDNSSQGQTTANFEAEAVVANRTVQLDNFSRLLHLRLQETEYTQDELNFMYHMHNQSVYKMDNFQNPVSVDDYHCASTGSTDSIRLKKRLYSSLDDHQKLIFDEMRDELDQAGLVHLSNNQILRAFTSRPDKSQCVTQLRKVLDMRLQMQLNDMQETDFADLIAMKCIIDVGSYDREGRPIQFLLLRNMNLKKTSVEHFSRYCVFESDRAARRTKPCTDEVLIVVDFQGFGFSQMYMSHIKAAASLIQELNCGRLTLTKIVNGGKILSSVQSMFSRFFTESAKENFEIMGIDFKQQLNQYISPDNLPVEYGGTMTTLT